MPGYAKVPKHIWIDERFRTLPEESRHLLLYLMTSPHATSLGYYRLPNRYISADLQWGIRRLKKAWEPLAKSGLARHCDITEIVFLPENFKFNAPENSNVTKKWKSMLSELPYSPLLRDFVSAARKYLPNGWQTAWLSELEERVTQRVTETLSEEPSEPFPKGMAIPVTRNPKPVTRSPIPLSPLPEAPSEERRQASLTLAPDPRVKEVLDGIAARAGYQIPNYAKEGSAVKRAFKMGFSREQFLACWEKMKTFEFWKGKWLPLAKVTENLGEFVAGRLEDERRQHGTKKGRRLGEPGRDPLQVSRRRGLTIIEDGSGEEGG